MALTNCWKVSAGEIVVSRSDMDPFSRNGTASVTSGWPALLHPFPLDPAHLNLHRLLAQVLMARFQADGPGGLLGLHPHGARATAQRERVLAYDLARSGEAQLNCPGGERTQIPAGIGDS